MTTPTREELLKLAKEADIWDAVSETTYPLPIAALERFSSLLSAHQAQPVSKELRGRLRRAVVFMENGERVNMPQLANDIDALLSQSAAPSEQPAVQTAVPEGMIQVPAELLQNVATHAKIAADCIVRMAKEKPGNMCGWLDDACTHADIAHEELRKLLAAAPSPQGGDK